MKTEQRPNVNRTKSIESRNRHLVMNRNSIGIVFFLVLLYTVAFAKHALAYLDPGSGSMMLQLLLGGIAGVVVILKLYWKSFVSLFQREKHHKDSTPPSELDK